MIREQDATLASQLFEDDGNERAWDLDIVLATQSSASKIIESLPTPQIAKVSAAQP